LSKEVVTISRRNKIRKLNYLNNKDILKEIHKSKTAYCSFLQPEYADYDIILNSIADIPNAIEEGRIARADRLTKVAEEAAMLAADGKKVKCVSLVVDPATVLDSDIIFRVMTWEHIPEAPPSAPKIVKGKKAKIIIEEEAEELLTEYDEDIPDILPPIAAKYVKVNFKPFQHFKLEIDNEAQMIKAMCVGKSHWLGPLDTGSFSKDHGKITNKLALMYMKLCERYGTRSNWRGYTYNDEMRSQALLQLSQIGLQFDESKSANPFAYYTAAITNSFTRVLNIEKRNQNIRDDILEMNDFNPSYTRQNSWGGDGHGADE
jgi:hypothetical protein